MRAGPLALLLGGLVIAAPVRAETRASPVPPRAFAALERAQALIRARQLDQGLALLDSLIAASPGAEGAAVRMRALSTKGGNLAFLGQNARAEPALEAALPIAKSLGDSTIFAESARWLAFAWLGAGRLREADSLYALALPVAAACGARGAEAYMLLGRAYVLMQTGRAREAIPRYRAVGAKFRELSDAYGDQQACIGLGRAHHAVGRLDSAAACYRTVAARANASGQLVAEGDALNNLGTIEYLRGDPGAALTAFRAALSLHRRANRSAASLPAARNVAMALAQLGRIEEADALIDSLETETRRLGQGLNANEVRLAKAQMYEDRDAAPAALSMYRSIVASELPLPADLALNARIGVSRALMRVGRDAEALAALDSIPPAIVDAAGPAARQEYFYGRAGALVRVGRNHQGMEAATQAARAAESTGRWSGASTSWGLAAIAATRSGEHAIAARNLDRSLASWEKCRTRSRALEWRDPSDQLGVSLVQAIGEVGLADRRSPAPVRVARVWEQLQCVKTRALLERLSSNDLRDSLERSLTLVELQRRGVRPGELLLDYYVGTDSTYVFAIDGRRARVVVLPGWRWVRDRGSAFATLLQSPSDGRGRAREFVSSAAAQTGRSIFGPHAAAVRSAGRLLISPDGPFASLPFEALRCPGEADWLATRHEVVYVPSMTLIADERARPASPPALRAPRLLVLAGTRNDSGTLLSGALAEARSLASRFEGAALRVDSGPRRDGDPSAELAGFDVLHVASHAVIDPERPWRSGLLLEPRRATSGEGWWRAEQIAEQSVPERLVVLSGCSTASGRARFGGGVEGLTAAFLRAGARAVVSSLWPVDDQVTASLMDVFYTRLSEGRTAAAALREARLALARRPATGAPRDWAAFVLTGEGDVRAPFRQRPAGVLGP